MSKILPVVLLSSVQMSALTWLRSIARRDNVVRNEWAHGTVEGYAGVKLNTLQALMDKGLVVNHKRTDHYRLIQNIDAQVKPEKNPGKAATQSIANESVEAAEVRVARTRKPRAKKEEVVVEAEQQAA